MPYRSLNPDLIIETVETLSHHMQQRFGGRGLTKVAEELTEFARQEAGLARKLARPRLFLRALVCLIILCALSVFGLLATGYYFAFFLVILPWLSKNEKGRDLPASIHEAVLAENKK